MTLKLQTLTDDSARQDDGFTLVELAVVMIIIGLLIGGILKGQELINNAQVSATISEIKSFDSALSGFRDQYNTFPGDMPQALANARIPNCAGDAVCSIATADGNGRIDSNTIEAPPQNENLAVWVQLNNANFITGIDGTVANAQWGQLQPDSAMGRGGYSIAYHEGNPFPLGLVGGGFRANPGHYIMLTLAPNAGVTGFLRATQAARLDRKLDDGNAFTGSTRAGPVNTPDIDGNGVYQEANETTSAIVMVFSLSG